MSALSAICVEPESPARYCIICLHGLGAGAEDLLPLAKQLKLNQHATVRFIFPSAPERPVSANGGYFMPAWYDILAFSPQRQINLQHLNQVSAQVSQLVEQQMAQGIASENIILMGFSQGGAVAYHCALNTTKPLGGLVCMSTYLLPQSLPKQPWQLNTPILIQHGQQDDVVAPSLGQQAAEQLKALGYHTEFESFTMAHTISLSQIKALSLWLNQRLS
ncbi:alpha/beta hydrolase [Agarivorans sp.]|uniref:alpha/beta hydrolase n=1 Tax=Agarivorans sp. TaxID=1872412 RepID=UPI003D03E311